jgi:hypothetical protein
VEEAVEEVVDTEYWEDKDSMGRVGAGTESREMGFVVEEAVD